MSSAAERAAQRARMLAGVSVSKFSATDYDALTLASFDNCKVRYVEDALDDNSVSIVTETHLQRRLRNNKLYIVDGWCMQVDAKVDSFIKR